MADGIDLKVLVKHIADGTFEESLCRVCLKPLGVLFENIFTKVCKEDLEFCIADVLTDLCNEQFSDTDSYNVCSDCFLMATTAYKFFLMEKRSKEYLQFYIKELTKNVNSIEMPVNDPNDTLCITLPKYTPTIQNIDFGILFCLNKDYYIEFPDPEPIETEDDKLLVLVEENGVQLVYAMDEDLLNYKKKYKMEDEIATKSKTRRKRTAMEYRKCSQCPVKYRFFAKLKLHMKEAHNIDLFLCKVCKETVEGETWFDRHIKTHTDIHRCNICNTVFKKRDTIIAHLKWHAEMKEMSNMEGAHVCEICGYILPNEDQLKEHCDQKHEKKYTCHYCGKMYRGESSCQAHVLKHERHLQKKNLSPTPHSSSGSPHSSPPSSPRSSTDEEWASRSPRAKPYARSPRSSDNRRSRTKELNKYAASRYRQKKKAEIEVLLSEEQQLRAAHSQLGERCADLQREIRHLEGHMRDLFKAKGLIKSLPTLRRTMGYDGRVSGTALYQRARRKFKNEIDSPKEKKITRRKNNNSKSSPICATCGRSFVDERALMWHLMLHTNERPYTCDVCGRGFISVNRRNQHVLCAHTMPTKRCPLCPSLFHLRSMVNSHIKKVHLKAHKRRNRSSKHRKVHWKTETVPIEELSVDIQNEILEIRTNLPDDKETLPLSAIDDDDPVFDDNWEMGATQRDVTQF